MDLSTTFCGLDLKNPLIAGASPMTATLDGLKAFEDAGVAAVIMHSLFEEQINHELRSIDHFLHANSESYAEALGFFPERELFDTIRSDAYIKELENAKAALDIPVIASLNGVSKGGWITYAKTLESAGADALELNITYIPTSIEKSGAEVERMYLETLKSVRENISIALNVKMNAFFSSPAYMAAQFINLGADGLTLFDNPSRVNVDLESLSALRQATPTDASRLSESLRWCAIIFKQLETSICAGTGIHSGEDILKALMSGANAVTATSAFLLRGAGEATRMLESMKQWMQEHEYESLRQMIGSISLAHTDNPSAYERNSYMYALQHYRS